MSQCQIVECRHCGWIGNESDIETAEPGLADDPGQCPSCKTPNDWSRIGRVLAGLREYRQVLVNQCEAYEKRIEALEAELTDLRESYTQMQKVVSNQGIRDIEQLEELTDLRAVEEAVGTTISPVWMDPCLKKAIDNYRSRWQSGEKEEPPRSTQLSQTKHKTHMTAELTGTYEPAE